jgi:aryl-alcohol dehydrogenase-like predicted oxidoreductase
MLYGDMMKRLGKGRLKVSPIGLGCFAIGGPFQGSNGRKLAYGPVDDNVSKQTIQKAIDMGINFFDTADVYGFGRSERVLGEALEGYERKDVVIATKFANKFDEKAKKALGKNVQPDYVHQALESSLKRLKTDYIDLYQLHDSRHDPESAKRVRETLEDLVSEGKIRGYGWSTDDVNKARIFAEGTNCIAIQYAIHITRNNPKMIKLCEKYDLVGVIRSPLGSGTLTGKYTKEYVSLISKDHMLHNGSFVESEPYIKRMKRIEEVKKLLEETGYTPIQIFLSYLLSTSNTTVPIPGAKTSEQIEENAYIIQNPPPDSLVKEVNSLMEDLRIFV